MKKDFLKLNVLILALIFSHTAFAQWGVKGNGNVTESSREVSGVTNVSVGNGIDLFVSTADGAETCIIEADENLHDLIKTKISGNKMSIYLSKSVNRAKSLKVYLTLNELTELEAKQGSDIKSVNIIKFNKLNLICTSGSDAELELTGNEFSCECRSGSDIELSGKTNILRIDVSSGSDIAAFKFKAKDVYINASSGSDAEIYAEGKLFVRASSGSDVDYKGNPESIDVELSSGADLNRN